MQINDALMLDASGLSFTRDGYLIGEARIARAGNVQAYRGRELGFDDDRADAIFGVYRDPETVFDEQSMASLAGRPVTRGHPREDVSAKTWRDLAIGQVGGVIKRDGDHVVASMAIMDAEAAQEVMTGARALSAGYTVQVVADEGVAEDGTPYQFRQAGELRFNHVAYLPDNNPRAGNTRIGDAGDGGRDRKSQPSLKKEAGMADALKTLVFGDEAVQVAIADAAKIEKWKADQAKALADAAASHKSEIEVKDEEIGKLKADLKTAQDSLPKADDLDRLVADRQALVDTARKIVSDFDATGKDAADIRKEVVAAKLGDEAVKDASEAEIKGMFRAVSADAVRPDPVRDAMPTAKRTTSVSDEDSAYAEYLADFNKKGA